MTIDVHGHLSPPRSLRRYPMPRSLGDAEGMIERKLRDGVTVTVIGSPVGGGAMVPLPGVDNYAQDVDELRAFHEWEAGLVRRYPEHLRAYVYVNPFGGEKQLALAAELAAEPEFVGLIVNTSINGRHLLDPDAGDFFALAADLAVPVLLHAPAAPAAGAGLLDMLLVEQLGRFCDVTIGVAACILGGWLDRYPQLRLIAATGGGALALLPEKLDLTWSAPHWNQGGSPGSGQPAPSTAASPVGRPRRQLPELADRPSSYLRRIWVDTATPSEQALALNLRTFGPDRVLFGTDCPPADHSVVAGALRAIDRVVPDDAGRLAIRQGNARALFGPVLPGS